MAITSFGFPAINTQSPGRVPSTLPHIHSHISTLRIISPSLLSCGSHTPQPHPESIILDSPLSSCSKTMNPSFSSSSSSFEIQQANPSEIPSQTVQNRSNNDLEAQVPPSTPDLDLVPVVDYSKRAQWLRAAVLGANDGLLSTASLMMGVGAVRTDVKTMILTGIAGLVAGACSMALGEFVSVYSQCDIELAQMKRERIANTIDKSEYDAKKEDLPSPLQAAGASAFAFALGAAVPLVAAAFVKSYHVRLGVVVAASSLALLGFGGLGAFLGKAPLVRSSLRVLVGGWMAMGITFGITKLIGKTGV